MKRLRLWIKELSLSQQLLTIIFSVIAVFFVFNMVFLSQSVDSYVSNEMYNMLHRSQLQMKYYLENDVKVEDMQVYDPSIVNVLFHSGNNFRIVGDGDVPPGLIYMVSQTLQTVPVMESVDLSYVTAEEEYLYTICRVDGDSYLISMFPDTSRIQYRNNLMNTVVNMNMFVMAAIFTILMLWVSSLIHPLNQMKIYLDKITNDEPATLNIVRRDEIGKVAGAIVDMKEELEHQNRIKEEMIQNISHDLKTPIATIKSYAESIQDGIYPYGSLEKSCDVIIEHASRLEKKVYSLILLNKMEYLKDNGEPGESLAMVPIIQKVASNFGVIHPEIEIRLNVNDVKFHGEEEPWRILV
ncbi:MAG: HAMP domain-containing histidine kinase, partial [Erysipelotrichaceae bacterium]|nr:HAMP domain-containing histidine kinase [Erysipelotrichaceae bacterium]